MNSPGHIVLFCGPMFARKTTTLVENWTGGDLILKPAIDTRYSLNSIVTHDGVERAALPVSSWPEKEVFLAPRIFIDEIQFFHSPWYKGDFIKEVLEAKTSGKTVFLAGLDRDWRGEFFRVTRSAMEIADQVIQLTALCSLCNNDATLTWRRGGNGSTIELGGEDIYEPRCTKHHPLVGSVLHGGAEGRAAGE